MLLCNDLSNVFALQATLVVGRTFEFVLYATVDQHKLIAFGMPREVFHFTAAAVHAHQVASLAKARNGLVHDATIHTNVLVLSALTNAGKLHAVDLVVAKEVVECESVSALKSSTARHTCTERHITSKSCVETFNGYTQCHHLAAYTINVACPSSVRTFFVVERELHTVFEVNAVGINNACAIGFDFGNHTLLYSTWKYIAVVVVSVFANEVNTSRSCINASRCAAEVLDKAAAYVFDG